MFRRTMNVVLAASAMGAVGLGCGQGGDTEVSTESAVLGDAIAGTNAATFAAARANFNLTETVQDGAGPIFNERSCSACHSNSARSAAPVRTSSDATDASSTACSTPWRARAARCASCSVSAASTPAPA